MRERSRRTSSALISLLGVTSFMFRTERENFRKLNSALEVERGRSKAASERDTETIIELRTALEMEREQQQHFYKQQSAAVMHQKMLGEGMGAIEERPEGCHCYDCSRAPT